MQETHSLSVELTDDETSDHSEETSDRSDVTTIYYEDEPSDAMQELLLKREEFHSFELLPICTVVLVGMMFGLCLNKGRVFEPNVIIEQMTFERFIMLKLFLSAAGSSAIVLAICSYLYKEQFLYARLKYRNDFGVLKVLFGGLLLGIGLTTAGSCPGMVLVQCGAGVPFSYVTLLGLLFGGFLCVLIKPLLLFNDNKIYCVLDYTFIDEYFIENIHFNYRTIAIIFGIFCWIIVIIFECIWSWESELTIPNEIDCNFLTCSSWPPAISGLIIGILQMPLVSVIGNAIGCSNSYVCIMCQWLRPCNKIIKEIFMTHLKNDLNQWWQILFILSITFGSWISVGLTGQSLNVTKYPYDNIQGVGELRAFCGGMLMIFGARIAGGCSSGHGLSGFGLLNIYSMCVIASMFTGGIITAFII